MVDKKGNPASPKPQKEIGVCDLGNGILVKYSKNNTNQVKNPCAYIRMCFKKFVAKNKQKIICCINRMYLHLSTLNKR